MAWWFPVVQLKHRCLLRRICLRSATLVIFIHSAALWSSPQYRQGQQRGFESASLRAWLILDGHKFRFTVCCSCSRSCWLASTGFLLIHRRIASDSCEKSHFSHSGSWRTRSPRIAGNLSSVIETMPLTCVSYFIACNACTQYVSFSPNSQIFFGLPLGTVGRSSSSFV